MPRPPRASDLRPERIETEQSGRRGPFAWVIWQRNRCPQLRDLALEIGVLEFQFVDVDAEFAHRSVFGRCGHRGLRVEGATALGFAGVD